MPLDTIYATSDEAGEECVSGGNSNSASYFKEGSRNVRFAPYSRFELESSSFAENNTVRTVSLSYAPFHTRTQTLAPTHTHSLSLSLSLRLTVLQSPALIPFPL